MLADKEVQNVLIVGCGGGFDFVHSLLLYNSLVEMGKNVFVGSYSFGDPRDIKGKNAKQVFPLASSPFESNGKNMVLSVDASCVGNESYCPEIGFCKFLDQQYPQRAPHSIYAYYARAFTVKSLSALYLQLVEMHAIDAIVAIDGGSDSLMRGDEEGLGDPIEDAVTVAAVAAVCRPPRPREQQATFGGATGESSSSIVDGGAMRRPPLGILCAIGLGCDRFNGVTDADSFRAISAVTRLGGFMGSVSVEPESDALAAYSAGLRTIYSGQSFRSVLSGAIVAAALGFHGTPDFEALQRAGGVDFDYRIKSCPFSLALSPFMAVIWFFDIKCIAERYGMSEHTRFIHPCTIILFHF